ncbi:MAG: magnesium transporter [Pirellulales bacterium]|nr:magnesium transporter [Pirellulales bacterium]
MPVQAQQHLSDPIVRHLRKDFARVSVGQTVGEALAQIRREPPEGRIIYFYAVDGEGRLQGVLPTRRLLLSPLETPVTEIMVREVIGIPPNATVLDACEFFIMHRLLAFPVIDEDRRIMGVVDVELYTAELGDIERSERYDDLFQLIGVHLSGALQSSPFLAFRRRFPWLLCNIFGGLAAAFLAGVFERELKLAAALAMFIPVVLALSESVSIQSVSLTLQYLRGRPPTVKTLLAKIGHEMGTGIFLGCASAICVAAAAFLWLGEGRLAVCLLGGISGGVVCSAGFGVGLPMLLRIVKRDPHVASGPMALAAADLATLLFYFSLARWMWG